ncbi:MAG: carbamoyl phosphate synthase small subunit [Lachnospiraceae bacterium]|jgi:carbamoyl-phosphate synthase small subunit
MKATLMLENGAVFTGTSMGSAKTSVCEMVFNTSMVGYQEILTDPSYAGQGIVMTYPLIGNYGVNSEDNQSRKPWASAMIVRRLSPRGSNFRNEDTLDNYLKKYDITGICGVDTRAITRILRDQGTMNGIITAEENFDHAEAQRLIHSYHVAGTVERTTREQVQVYPGDGKNVAFLDLGAKEEMIRLLQKRGCRVTAYPAHTPAETILAGNYDGIMLSNGPGDPADNPDIIAEIRKLCASGIPIFAVCLGHQLMALAAGAKTGKLKYGHRGANHPVKDLETGRVYITSQNHGYVVLADSVNPEIAEISHVNVNDGTVEGLRYKNKKIFTVQFHPEACPGPRDTEYLFDRFMDLMKGE